MNYRLYFSTICLIGVLSGFVCAADADVLLLIKEAKQVARKNDPKTTRAAYAKILAADNATPRQKSDAYCDIAKVLQKKKQYEAAGAEYDKALALPGLSAQDRIAVLKKKANAAFSSNFQGKWTPYYTTGIESALACYQAILKTKGVTNAQAIEAYKKVADCQFEMQKLKEANAALAAAITLPGLSPAERLRARMNQATGFYRQLAYDKALPLLNTLLVPLVPELDEALPYPLHNTLYGKSRLRSDDKKRVIAMIQTILREEGRKEELARFQKPLNRSPLTVAAEFAEAGDPKAIAAYRAILDDGKARLNDRRQALEKLLEIHAKAQNLPELKATAERYVPAMAKESKGIWTIYTNYLQRHWRIMRYGLRRSAGYTVWVNTHILEAPDLRPAERIKAQDRIMDAHLRLGEVDAARKAAKKLLSMNGLPPKVALHAKMRFHVLETNGTPGKIVSTIQSLAPAIEDKTKLAKEQAALLGTAAKYAMMARYTKVAKALDASHQALLVARSRRSLPCTFLENGPKDISEFLASDYFKNPKNRGTLDRKYGKNLKLLLETDAAITGRVITDNKGKAFTPTQFTATCDAEGIHLFFFAPCDNTKDVAAGLAGSAGYEIYFAGGAGRPYNCYLVDTASGMGDTFVTQYNNAHFRNAWQKDKTAKIQHRVVKGGVVSLLSLSWLAFFDRIPENGDKFEMEAIHWGHRGYTWGGSKSVHHRSGYGDLVFQNMTKENRNAIKRRIIVAAAKAYRKELSPYNGYLEIWQDPELGDREFYKTVLVPFQAKFDADLPLVKAGMTDAQVERIYRDSAKTWMNIRYVVGDLRKDYLDKKRVTHR